MDYAGLWNDGRSARRTAVRVRLLGHRLAVSEAERDRPLLELPLKGLRLAEEVYAGQPVRLRHDDWPDGRLTVVDHALMDKLVAAHPPLGRRYHARRGTFHRLVVWGGALAGTVLALLGAVHFGAEPLAAMVPLEWEEQLGEQTMADFVDRYGACDVGTGVAHVEALAGRLGVAADSGYRFRVQILEGDQVNAVALPGGYIAIFDGLVKEADGPNEVAGVVAHEVAHVIERHALEQLVRSSGYSMLAALVTGDMNGFAVLAGDAATFAADMANSRADEAQADRLAIRLLNTVGIDSRGLPRFFEKQEQAGSPLPGALALLSTHPASDARLRETRGLAREGEDALSAEAWRAVREACPGRATETEVSR